MNSFWRLTVNPLLRILWWNTDGFHSQGYDSEVVLLSELLDLVDSMA